jgi:hypothetical protein
MAEANQFELTGHHAHLTYSTTSITGKPLLHFQDAHHNVNAQGDQITRLDSDLGTLVTVTLSVSALNNVRLTLVVPRILFHQQTDHTTLETIAILTTTQTESIAPVRQTYQVLTLHGKASSVMF